jgi:hypothetical protein
MSSMLDARIVFLADFGLNIWGDRTPSHVCAEIFALSHDPGFHVAIVDRRCLVPWRFKTFEAVVKILGTLSGSRCRFWGGTN